MIPAPCYKDRPGTLLLRSPDMKYNPRVLNSLWHVVRQSYPKDYDAETAPEINQFRASYHRWGTLYNDIPTPTTREAMEQGIHHIKSMRDYSERRSVVNTFSLCHTDVDRTNEEGKVLTHKYEPEPKSLYLSTTHDHYRAPRFPILPTKLVPCPPPECNPLVYHKCSTGLTSPEMSRNKFMDEVESTALLDAKKEMNLCQHDPIHTCSRCVSKLREQEYNCQKTNFY